MWPGIFLTIVVYSFNMFVDAVRDLLDRLMLMLLLLLMPA